MDLIQQHERDVGKIQDQLLLADKESKLTFSQKKNVSNTVRAKPYAQQGAKLSLEQLNRVLEVDTQKRIAYVEPRVTMEQLVQATLPYGLVPPVVPEFKSITVGGAINGTALESSSHRYGQFNDCCRSYEVLLGDGARLEVSPTKAADLFYGMAGSYGSLGAIVGAKVDLIPAKPWVEVAYRRFTSIQKAVVFMTEEHHRNDGPEFIEAIVYGPDEAVVIVGSPKDDADLSPGVPKTDFKRWWSQWYYLHARKHAEEKEAIPLVDYLFRSDRAAFWMGGYALHKPLLFRYILEYCGYCPRWLDRLLMGERKARYGEIKEAGLLFRFLTGKIMGSEQLYRFMHRDTEKWFAKNFVIQDYYLPQSETALFTHEVIARFGIAPIWLCPMKPTSKPQIFSPHYVNGRQPEELLFDVGVYGMGERLAGNIVSSELDHLTVAKGGRKMLYSYSYYTREEFWELYNEELYRKLRCDYFAEARFREITDKVL